MEQITKENFDKLAANEYFNVSLGEKTCFPCPVCGERSIKININCDCLEKHGYHTMGKHHFCNLKK